MGGRGHGGLSCPLLPYDPFRTVDVHRLPPRIGRWRARPDPLGFNQLARIRGQKNDDSSKVFVWFLYTARVGFSTEGVSRRRGHSTGVYAL